MKASQLHDATFFFSPLLSFLLFCFVEVAVFVLVLMDLNLGINVKYFVIFAAVAFSSSRIFIEQLSLISAFVYCNLEPS